MSVVVQNQLTVAGFGSNLGVVTCPSGTTSLIWEESYAGDGSYFRQVLDASNDPEFATIASGSPASMGIFVRPTRPPGNLDVTITCVVGPANTIYPGASFSTHWTIGMVVAEQFSDVAPGKFYVASVNWARASEITNGTSCTTFSPDDAVTRWQMALFLKRLADWAGLAPVGTTDTFTDTGSLATATRQAIGWLAATGVTTGVTPTTFNPDGTVTRLQMALFLERFARLAAIDTTSEPDTFADTSDLRTSWRRAIGWLAATGVTTGTTATTFSPDDSVTRGQMVTFLDRLDLLIP